MPTTTLRSADSAFVKVAFTQTEADGEVDLLTARHFVTDALAANHGVMGSSVNIDLLSLTRVDPTTYAAVFRCSLRDLAIVRDALASRTDKSKRLHSRVLSAAHYLSAL
ncbi:hypothetical protein PYCC9005_000197 [Savitreella phatthalungensis]